MQGNEQLINAVSAVQRIPYAWPGPWTAASVRATGQGTCASKHALLQEELATLGLAAAPLMVVGPLVPDLWPDLQAASDGLLEVHECLTVATDWAGPLIIDVTWHPPAVHAGLPGTLGWDGASDMICAVEPLRSYAIQDNFREQKELLRRRLYSKNQRAQRDAILTEIAARAVGLTT